MQAAGGGEHIQQAVAAHRQRHRALAAPSPISVTLLDSACDTFTSTCGFCAFPVSNFTMLS